MKQEVSTSYLSCTYFECQVANFPFIVNKLYIYYCNIPSCMNLSTFCQNIHFVLMEFLHNQIIQQNLPFTIQALPKVEEKIVNQI